MVKTSIDQIPFKTIAFLDGRVERELAGYVAYYDHDIEWVSNTAFTDTLKFIGFERGRSAAHAIFKSETSGTRYQVFLVDLETIIQSEMWDRGKITSSFIGCKHGTNYGIRLNT